jgi:hypothetical protein
MFSWLTYAFEEFLRRQIPISIQMVSILFTGVHYLDLINDRDQLHHQEVSPKWQNESL